MPTSKALNLALPLTSSLQARLRIPLIGVLSVFQPHVLQSADQPQSHERVAVAAPGACGCVESRTDALIRADTGCFAAARAPSVLKTPRSLPIRELMASVGSVNSGVSTLLQTFSRTGSSALSSALSSSTAQAALKNAAPVDIVQLSDQAVQLQQALSLFGYGSSATSASDPGTQALQALNQPTQNQQDAAATAINTTDSGTPYAAATAAWTTSSAAASETSSEAVASYLFGPGSAAGGGSSTISFLA